MSDTADHAAMGFAFFETAIGRCSIVWNARGVVRTRLPERDEQATRDRIRSRYPAAHEASPPAEIRRAIDDMIALLGGEPKDLRGISLDISQVPEFNRRVYDIARDIPAGSTLTYGEIAQIPSQWRRFMADFYPRIEHKSQSIPVGIMTSGAEADSDLCYTCAVEVSRFNTTPEGLVTLAVKPASYVVFPHNRHITELTQTYTAIWNDWLPASGRKPAEAPSFEKPNATFDTRTGEGGVTLWIPLLE